ncbi:MAG: chemotaxis protein CheW [Rhodobacterales bacterium RIFCSPHIGHO2_02_FULL_62_130]|jgi:purine-binding chemotaxis protein CheW|nr:MAG: chemotaxis protein CheW [Rhodobacterales bacterium RIFCSPHIGHO2_02_FULL_62_130]OHC55959.1 MAG: chemotaxis protein CheW [Rhodobacterales bacterium RIFCSPHIGHO2_12_FULL_62_75]
MTDQLTEMTRSRAEGLPFTDTDNVDDMYLTFALDSEEYGVGIGQVTEIVGMQRIMAIPDMPAYIKGVINLRGKVIPLMDVRLRFDMPQREYDDRTVIIVMEVADAPIGLIVDGVREVLEIPPAQVDRPSQFGKSTGRNVIAGIGRIAERVAILLDASVLVSETDLGGVTDAIAAA